MSTRRPLKRTLATLAVLTAGVGVGAPAGSGRETSDAAADPHPRLGRTVVLVPVRGEVSFRRPESALYRRLRRPTAVPNGTVVRARAGEVRVRAARAAGDGLDSAAFFGGSFAVSQQTDPEVVTTLALRGPSFRSSCTTARASRVADQRPRRRRVRRLWGNGRGRFRTRGRYSAATVRGTRWLVEDRCDGTLTRVARGEVEVEDFTEEEAAPAPAPPPPQQPADGSEPPPSSAPAPAAGTESAPRRKKVVRVRRGRTYVARPRR